MLYPSVLFILYFLPAALLLYWTFRFSAKAQNMCLLVLSLVFYAWGEPLYLVPMFLLVIIDHVAGLRIAQNLHPVDKRRIVIWTVALNLLVFFLARYANTLAVWTSIHTGLRLAQLPPAPLGLAFFTLQGMSYVFDVGRRKRMAEPGILNTALYIAFLPTVLAGPILQYDDVADQFKTRTLSLPLFGEGCERFIIGLAKVLLLVVPLNYISDAVFNLSAAGNEIADTPVMLAWLGLIAYGVQIYLVFSGFSDMAIGLGRMFGFRLKENFRHPYVAHNIREFWRRCHISMFRWFFRLRVSFPGRFAPGQGQEPGRSAAAQPCPPQLGRAVAAYRLVARH